MKSANRGAGSTLIAALTALILTTRAPTRILNGYLWAEDARVFIAAAYKWGAASLFEPYAGYLHFLPRLIACISAAAAPVPEAPYQFVDWSLVVSVCISVYVYRATISLPWSRAPEMFAALLALSPWLIPHGGEVFLNITNLQWVLAPALMVLLWEFCRPGDVEPMAPAAYLMKVAALGALSITGPVGLILFVPAALSFAERMRRSNTWQSAVAFGVYAVGTAIQGCVYVATRDPHHQINGMYWLSELVNHLIGPMLLPQPIVDAFLQSPAAAAVLVLGCIIFGLVASPRRWVIGGLVFVALASWAAGMTRINDPRIHMSWFGGGSRYTYLPELCFFWLFIVLAGTVRIRMSYLAACAAAMMVLAGAARFAVVDDISWKAEKTGRVYMVTVPPGWTIRVSGGRLGVD